MSEGAASGSILTINAGSSSIRFALYGAGMPLTCALDGKVERIGMSGTSFAYHDRRADHRGALAMRGTDHASAATELFDWLAGREEFHAVRGVGHRVVHGMNHVQPEIVTPDLLRELHGIESYDPDHLPAELRLIEAFRERQPQTPQVACFDTAFHQTLPRVASMLAIPRCYEAQGVRRYGFHGLSYAYLMEELARLGGAEAASGRIVLAHLGGGASLAAVRDGQSIDTSMGFTPTAGLPMGTRSGDLDPGLAAYLSRSEQMSAQQFSDMANHSSGLLGISETSADMRDLLACENRDVRAAEAVALFCYQAKKWVGAYAAALGGLDTLVFAGGIGEHAAPVRERICEGLGFLGIALDAGRNAAHAPVISADSSAVTVRVMRTDEELMIARAVRNLHPNRDIKP